MMGTTIRLRSISPGETLSQRLRNMPGERLPIEDALEIGLICDVLDYLHAQTPPVIFSDLKPDNIMLTPEGNLYLIDFGIARLFQASLSDDRRFVHRATRRPNNTCILKSVLAPISTAWAQRFTNCFQGSTPQEIKMPLLA